MKTAGKIASILLLMVYIAASVGFRLHECTVDHTVEVLGVLEGEACEEVHHHICPPGDCCGHHHHHCEEDRPAAGQEGGVQIEEAGCCTNSLHVLSDARIASDGGDDLGGAKCFGAVFVSVPVSLSAKGGCGSACCICGTGGVLPGRTVLALYSVRRV